VLKSLTDLVDDDGMVRRIRWEEFVHLFGAEGLEQNGAFDLFIHVAAQVVGEHFAPGETVGCRPRFDLVISVE
jgi:hypothetical protein